jgi:hypothetical protein
MRRAVAQEFGDHPETAAGRMRWAPRHGGCAGWSVRSEDPADSRRRQLSLGQEPDRGALGYQVGVIRADGGKLVKARLRESVEWGAPLR